MAKLVQTPRLTPLPEEQNKQTNILGRSKGPSPSSIQKDLMSQTPSYENLKAFISSVLATNTYEEVLSGVVDEILKDEQMALTPQTKEQARFQKLLLGRALDEVVAYGDQQGLLYILTDRLGYRRKY